MADMYVFNPTKEDVTREAMGFEYTIPAGKALGVSREVGAFLIEARGEMAGVPQGGLTWFGLVPITAEDDLQQAAKRGLQNWVRLLNHRLLSIDQLVQEGTTSDGKQNFAVTRLLKDQRFIDWKANLEWAEAVLAGDVEYDGGGVVAEGLAKEVKPKRAPKGVEIVQQTDSLESQL